ncbi:SAM-dependent methyltransferase, partial [Staphylococcus epidermidis]|uniref:SAM-dependent methyltransferase n=1 Tax=Staphylococcus epidermidis TaxID=1282 RepID=UPI0021B1FACF
RYKGGIYDGCWGSGGMFVESEGLVEKDEGGLEDIGIYGEECKRRSWKLGKMKLGIGGIDNELGEGNGDRLDNDLDKGLKGD